MRGIYLFNEELQDASGVTKKVLNQVASFKKLGIEMELSYLIKDGRTIIRKIDNQIIEKYTKSIFGRIKKNFFYYSALEKYILSNNFNFIYIRYACFADQDFLKFLKNIKVQGIKILLEIPTYPYDEEFKDKNSRNELKKIAIEKKCRLLLKEYVDRIITFSNDSEIFGIKTIKISNGINLDDIKIADKKEKINEINFVGIAIISFWSGFDRMILSMAEYYKNNPNEIVKFHIVGDGDKKVVTELKNLVKKNNLEKYVIFYGYKSGKELDKIYEKIDIGIGNLGNFRKGLIDGGGLKNQEYCAKGLPFIIAGYDDNYKNVDFMYKISADESLINLNKIIDWYKNLQITPEQIRKYVEDNLTWDIQMKKVVDYILETEEIEKC